MRFQPKELELLVNVAFVAGAQRMLKEVQEITSTVRVLQPENRNVAICQAIAWLRTGGVPQAEEILREQILAHDPENSDARSLMSLVHYLKGDKTLSKQTAEKVLAAKCDSKTKRLAQEILAKLD